MPKEKRGILTFDTTQRDGMQTPEIKSWTHRQHMEYAGKVIDSGVSMIEAGFASAGENIQYQIREVSKIAGKTQIFSLAMLTEQSITDAYNSLKKAKNPAIHLFYATSPEHLKHKYGGKTNQEAIDNITNAILFAKKRFPVVMFSPEDATNTPTKFLNKVIKEARLAGVDIINIPDTLGRATPKQYGKLIKKLTVKFPDLQFSVHCHNDLGMATGNTMSAIQKNKSKHPLIIQGSFGGIGERAGNTPIEEVITACCVHGIPIDMDSKKITEIVQDVFSNSGWKIPRNKPIVGGNVYSHSSGIHAAAVLKNQSLYNAFSPELVGGRPVETKLTEQSGGGVLFTKMTELGIEIIDKYKTIYLERFKRLAIGRVEVYPQELYLLLIDEPYSSKIIKQNYISLESDNKFAAVEIQERDGTIVKKISTSKGMFKSIFDAINKIKKINQEIEPITFRIESEGLGPNQDAVVYIEIEIDGIKVSGASKEFDSPTAVANAYLECIDKIFEIKKIKESRNCSSSN